MKKLNVVGLVLILAIAMSSIAAAQEIQTGTFSYNGSTAEFTLHKGNGDRVYSAEINFEKPFTVKPTVIVSLNTIDANKNANFRVEAKATSISRDGFTIQIKTWSDSQINLVGGSWIAIAPAK